jgi:serine/alanine adding enzyme
MDRIEIHKSIDQIDKVQWEALATNSANASFFQTAACYEYYASLSFVKPFIYGASENNKLVGIICGYIIADGSILKKYFSRRAIIPGGIMTSLDVSENALRTLLSFTIGELKRKSIYTEIRNYSDYSIFKPVFIESGFNYNEHLNFHVSTSDIETSLKNISSTKRRDIKMSTKQGAEWGLCTSFEEIEELYVHLEYLYRTKVKVPLFPLEFFIKLFELESSRIFIIKYGGKVIGGSVCVALKDKILYEWFVCGEDGKYKNIFPSTLATWAAIEYASSNAFERFDMMGAGRPDEGYGVREFKSRFGGQLVEHGRYIRVNHPLLFKLGKFVIFFKKKRR